jgi:hypothetical protein
LTAALKKKMDVQRAVEKRNAAVLARRDTEEVRKKSEERSLHFADRLLRRNETEKHMRRPAAGMTSVAGGAKVVAISKKTAKRVVTTKRAAPAKKAKKVSGASSKRKRG